MDTELARTFLTVITAGNFIFEEKLIIVSTDPADRPEPGIGYIYIDWGPEFYARHSASFPDFIGPALTANIGWLGLQHILENSGSGYFPVRLVRQYLADGRLTDPQGGPEFSLSAYVVYPDDSDPDLFGVALGAMRDLAAVEPEEIDARDRC